MGLILYESSRQKGETVESSTRGSRQKGERDTGSNTPTSAVVLPIVLSMDGEESTPQARNFARMREADPRGVSPVDHSPVRWETAAERASADDASESGSYENARWRDPTYAAAAGAMLRVSLFESAGSAHGGLLEAAGSDVLGRIRGQRWVREASVPANVVRALAAVWRDNTALKIEAMTQGPGSVVKAYPRLMAALEAAVKGVEVDPALAVDALLGMALLSQLDPTIGDSLDLVQKVLEGDGGRLRRYLSDEASAVFMRGCFRASKGDRVGSMVDCAESLVLAKVQERRDPAQFQGLVWSFNISMGRSFQLNSRTEDALAAFQEVADSTNIALRDYPYCAGEAGGGKVSPVTGGRERDPMKLAKVVNCQYGGAHLLLRAHLENLKPASLGGGPILPVKRKELLRQGREMYSAAVVREVGLPKKAQATVAFDCKISCQRLLSQLPVTKKTQAAINTGASGSSLLECHFCGSVEHGGLKFCGACRIAAYCSKSCQTAHRKVHRPECEQLARSRI